MSDQNSKDMRTMRENQIKLQTQVSLFTDGLTTLNKRIGELLDKLDNHSQKSDAKIKALEDKITMELKGYVQFNDISEMQKIIYGSIGTILTFIGLAVLGLLIQK